VFLDRVAWRCPGSPCPRPAHFACDPIPGHRSQGVCYSSLEEYGELEAEREARAEGVGLGVAPTLVLSVRSPPLRGCMAPVPRPQKVTSCRPRSKAG
jgi:hypothetical protein